MPVAPPPPEALAERTRQVALFTPAVRRDIYRVLLSPTSPGAPPATPPAGASPSGVEAGLAVSRPAPGAAGGGACAFVMRGAPLPPGFALATDAELTTSIGMMGKTDAQSYALLVAFETFLARAAATWDAAQAAALSVEFLVAFGAELTPRLDVMNRIRTAKLSAAELKTLKSPPHNAFVEQSTLEMFQGE